MQPKIIPNSKILMAKPTKTDQKLQSQLGAAIAKMLMPDQTKQGPGTRTSKQAMAGTMDYATPLRAETPGLFAPEFKRHVFGKSRMGDSKHRES